ncbi:aromatic-ring-hydroxylating dioxygenase subunit beta [Paraburkholderia fungorum]|jgi:3-phenylpropionate/cinnamic acid dioxygenase small subunit|uniref:aromatic-ring-hydroxylating dioxygenase subunit beta n=1 Tax=Paraburkholderia fungorum TaxID=134537 RepID=UPI00241E6369|nr:aromatic-ring-hydroxylating dioxygenase subunit beta [Paraburkholderia fungorum]
MSTAAQEVTGQHRYRHQPPSLYVVASFYDWLTEVSADLAQAVVRGPDVVDDARQREIARALTVESRLLDQGALANEAYEHWLALYAEECAYWIPAGSPTPDPRQAVTLEFHDRRRLLDRVARLRTGLAFSQFPTSRTARQWSGLEVWPSVSRTDEWRARYSFTLVESREGHNRVLAGWNGFVLRQIGDHLRIVLKQVNLIDNESPQGNNSFFL